MSTPHERYEANAAAFYRDTGMMAPGKDQPAALGGPTYDERVDAWIEWLRSRALLVPLTEQPTVEPPK